MKMLVETSRPLRPAGFLAHFWIQEFLAGRLNPMTEEDNKFFSTCHMLRDPSRAQNLTAEVPHELLMIETQGSDETGHTQLSCICKNCRYHFVFIISTGFCGPQAGDQALSHHYTLKKADRFTNTTLDSKLYPLISVVEYECSVCQQNVLVEMTLPRLKAEWIRKITDSERIKAQIRVAKEENPARYATIDETRVPYTACETLNAYVTDLLRTDEPRKISVRNKRFYVQFGPACDDIFAYLGFTRQADDDGDGEQKWVMPQLPPESRTSLQSRRAFYEDVKSEIQSIICEDPQKASELQAVEALTKLEKALGCESRSYRGRTPGNEGGNAEILGTTADSDSSLLFYAYSRQVAKDPLNTEAYLQALKEIVVGRGDTELQIFVAQEESKQSVAPASSDKHSEVDLAYKHFGLDPGCAEPDDVIIGLYKNYRAQAPAQKFQHRKHLFHIGQARTSENIIQEASEAPMDLAEACAFLEVESVWDLEAIAAVAQTRISDQGNSSSTDLPLTILAMKAIARSRTDDPGIVKFEQTIMGIQASRYYEAVDSSIIVNTDNDTANESAMTDKPVGLANLRNTCYLNSILQYYNTVKAVRVLVLESALSSLEPTQTHVERILADLNLPGLEPGRAFVGNEFVCELQKLFLAIQSTKESHVTPRQRLANAALLRPDKLRAQSDDQQKGEETSTGTAFNNKEAPPLPPRDGTGVQACSTGNIKPQVTVEPVAENEETASNVSSQTLVNQSEEDPTYVVVGHGPDQTNGVSVDAEMIDLCTDKPDESNGATVEDGATETALPSASIKQQSKLTVEELMAELEKPNVGSDQMDVDEVMGLTIDHLQNGFRVSSIGQSGSSLDPIEAAFFSTFVDCRKKATDADWNRSERLDRWVTAVPAPRTSKRTIHLHEALEASFDREDMREQNMVSFIAIKKPAPHFHVYLHRSDAGGKNTNSVTVPETLFLDRYMDGDDGSEIFRRRKRGWDIKTRLAQIEKSSVFEEGEIQSASPIGPINASPSREDVDLYIAAADSSDELTTSIRPLVATQPNGGLSTGSWSVVDSEQLRTVRQNHPEYKNSWESWPAYKPEATAIDKAANDNDGTIDHPELDAFLTKFNQSRQDEHAKLTEERRTLFDDFQSVKYRLHAVICHLGASASAGHYWVWIRDFEKNVWRRYNDTTVTEHSEAYVFEQLQGSEPYYLAYVRDRDIHELVGVPHRAKEPAETQPDEMCLDETQRPSDVDMVEAPPMITAMHVEHVGNVENVENVENAEQLEHVEHLDRQPLSQNA